MSTTVVTKYSRKSMKVMFASVKGNKLIVKIQKGRMLAEL